MGWNSARHPLWAAQALAAEQARAANGTVSPSTGAEALPLRPARQDGKVGYINPQGKMVVEPQFDSGWEFSEGLAAVQLGERWGFVDGQGKLVIPAQFDQCSSFSEGLAAVRRDGKWGFIDRQGNLAGRETFEMARSFSEGLAAVRIGEKWGYTDRKMTLVIKPTFEDAWHFSYGLAPVKLNGKWGYADRTGRVAIAPRFYWAEEFSEGLAFVEGGAGNEGYLDLTGRLVIPGRFFQAQPFSGGLAAVLTNASGTQGLIDRSGRMVVPARFEEVGLFSEGSAPARVPGEDWWRRGYIGTNGTMMIKPQFSRADRFSGGLAFACDGRGNAGYINKAGAFVWVATNSPGAAQPPKPARQFDNARMKVQLEGPAQVPPEFVSVVGNPWRKRFPDGQNWKPDKPSVFARNVWGMAVYQGRIYAGSGDYWNNTGPTDIYSFAPGENHFTLEYAAPDEMVSKFYVFEDKLVVPGNDPQESWEFGNVYLKEAGHWRKVRTIPNGLHCFNLAYAQGYLFAIVDTEHLPKLLASRDWGKSWDAVVCQSFPDTLFTDKDRLFGFDSVHGLSCYENGVLYHEHAALKNARFPEDAAVAWPKWACAEAVPFAGRIVLLSAGTVTSLEYGPFPLFFLGPGQAKPSVIDLFADWNVVESFLSGETLYVLCTRSAGGAGFNNAIYSTRDMKTWRCRVAFETSSFARSFVAFSGEFYVGIGCCGFTSDPLPDSTGDILRVIPRR